MTVTTARAATAFEVAELFVLGPKVVSGTDASSGLSTDRTSIGATAIGSGTATLEVEGTGTASAGTTLVGDAGPFTTQRATPAIQVLGAIGVIKGRATSVA